MKEPWEWEKEDVLALLGKAEESWQLELKRAAALQNTEPKKDEISKDVSAFANSSGGTIVYGIAGEGKPSVAKDIDPVDPSVVSAEWLEQVINSRISPRISGVKIHTVKLGTKHQGKVVYVVYVPQGMTAHQAHDKKFYRRFNFQSVAMGQYEVADKFGRNARPRLVVAVSYKSRETSATRHQYELQVSVSNQGSALSRFWGFDLEFPNLGAVPSNSRLKIETLDENLEPVPKFSNRGYTLSEKFRVKSHSSH